MSGPRISIKASVSREPWYVCTGEVELQGNPKDLERSCIQVQEQKIAEKCKRREEGMGKEVRGQGTCKAFPGDCLWSGPIKPEGGCIRLWELMEAVGSPQSGGGK